MFVGPLLIDIPTDAVGGSEVSMLIPQGSYRSVQLRRRWLRSGVASGVQNAAQVLEGWLGDHDLLRADDHRGRDPVTVVESQHVRMRRRVEVDVDIFVHHAHRSKAVNDERCVLTRGGPQDADAVAHSGNDSPGPR